MPTRPSHRPVQPNQSVERAIACLMELTALGRPVTCKEMAERLGVERTRASRVLGTLAHLGMAERLQDLSYIPGSGIHVLSAMSLRSSGLLRHALPHIQRMQHKWGLSVALGVLWRDQVSFLYHSGGHRAVADSIAGAEPWPVAKSTLGRVLLARKEDDEIRAILGEKLSAQEWDDLMMAMARIRRDGYVLHEGEGLSMAISTPATAGLRFMGGYDASRSEELVEDARVIVEDIAWRVESPRREPQAHEADRSPSN